MNFRSADALFLTEVSLQLNGPSSTPQPILSLIPVTFYLILNHFSPGFLFALLIGLEVCGSEIEPHVASNSLYIDKDDPVFLISLPLPLEFQDYIVLIHDTWAPGFIRYWGSNLGPCSY